MLIAQFCFQCYNIKYEEIDQSLNGLDAIVKRVFPYTSSVLFGTADSLFREAPLTITRHFLEYFCMRSTS